MSLKEHWRIVMVAPGFPSSAKDPDKPFLLNHARALVDAGFEVTVICPVAGDAAARQIIDGVEIVRVRYAPRRFETLAETGAMYRQARGRRALLVIPMLIAMLVRTVRESRRETIAIYGHWWIPSGLVAVLAARLCRVASVVQLHGSDVVVAKSGLMRRLARFVLQRADVRLAVSERLAQWARELCNCEVSVLSMPVNFDYLPAISPAPADGFVLGVGRLVPEKGFDLLVEAFAISELGSSVGLTIVGEGPERSRLAALAKRLNVSLSMPGAVAPEDLGHWYQQARIVAVPSRREGFGLVAAEAAASGRAVVGSKVGSISEIIESGVSGILVESENVDALSEALSNIDPRWGSAGPAKVSHLSFEQHSDRVRRICEKFVAK